MRASPDLREDDTSPAGAAERVWLARRRMGVARIRDHFADIDHGGSLAQLSHALRDVIVEADLGELDAATVRRVAPRSSPSASHATSTIRPRLVEPAASTA